MKNQELRASVSPKTLAHIAATFFCRHTEKETLEALETYFSDALAALPSGEPPQPRCPKCGKDKIAIEKSNIRGYVAQVGCPDCGYFSLCIKLSDFAQFFGPSAPQPPHDVTKFRDMLRRLVDAAIVLCADYLSIWEREPDSKTVQGQDLGRWRLLLKVHTEARELLSGAAPSGSAGQEPPVCDGCGAGPMLDRGTFYDCFACGHNREKTLVRTNPCPQCGSTLIHKLCSDAARIERALLTEKLRRADLEIEALNKEIENLEPEGRAESAAELRKNFPYVDEVAARLADDFTAESVVSASPAKEDCFICDGNKRVEIDCPNCAAAQPVAGNPKEVMPPGTDKTTEQKSHACRSDSASAASLKTSGLANPPKVEEIAKQIAMECYDSMVLSAAQEIKIKDIAEAILGPFFTQVSQPPQQIDWPKWAEIVCGACQVMDGWQGDESWSQFDREIRIGLSAILKSIYAFMDKPVAPVTPVSAPLTQTRFAEFDDADHPFNQWWQKHGQYMMSGGGRKQFIWACRGWIAREQLAEGVEVTGDSMHEKPAVSGNGTEPPDALRKAVLKSVLELKHVASHNIEPPFEVHAAALQLCMEREAEKLETALAGAASHNGQGWTFLPQLPPEDEKVLIAVMSEADDHSTGMTVRFPEVYRGTIYTAPGMVIADCEGSGEYENDEILGWQPLPAPPSEANGPQTKENK